jgi:dTDP-4-amino-4,6-dideoxygalactose transaminase
MRIPFANLKRGTEALRSEIEAAVARVMDSGWYVLGEEGRAFETEFAAFVGGRYAVGVASGTDAIELALRALRIGPGDEVITQANTCVPTVAGIERTGATPVLCDVEEDGATMDVASLRTALGPRTRAIIPVHLYGQCADVDAIVEAAGGIPVVEDCAQAHGAGLRGRQAGSIGLLGCFSFYPTKNLGALGDGGAVTTDDEALAERLRLVRQYGQTDRYHHVERGVNSRLDEVQAAVLRVKLPKLNAWNARRAEIAAAYDDALRGTAARPLARLPERRHVYHLYVVELPERDAFQAQLAEAGISTLVHYPQPVHGHPPYRALGAGAIDLGVAERLTSRIVSLPLYPELTDAEVEHVCRSLGTVLAAGSVPAW